MIAGSLLNQITLRSLSSTQGPFFAQFMSRSDFTSMQTRNEDIPFFNLGMKKTRQNKKT